MAEELHKDREMSAETREAWALDGVRLEIVAVELAEGQWKVEIENEHRTRFRRPGVFRESAAALKVGRDAIEQEGPEKFAPIRDGLRCKKGNPLSTMAKDILSRRGDPRR